MDPARYQLAFEAFLHCMTLDPGGRLEHLEERFESDGELCRLVLELLESAERAGGETFSDRLGLAQPLGAPVREDPERIGGYRIVRLLGQGGMGRVYEAEQETPRRRVALKLIDPLVRAGPLRRRFELEADVLARLQHPGIAPIFAYGEHHGPHGPQPWFAMELVEGLDVRTHAARNGLDVDARAALVADIADAIDHAHERGIIHRDLKPDNVLVDGRGRPRVLDFGIAHIADDSTLLRTAMTETGQILGTLNYMAPEQLAGDGRRFGPPTDVYALGVILFELLAGRRPHDLAGISLPAAIRVVTDEEAPRLRSLVPAIPRDLETIVQKALEKDPVRRFEGAGALAADLRRFLGRRPIAARPPSAVYVASRFAGRHRGLVLGASVACVTLVAAFVVVLEFARREGDARVEAEKVALDSLATTYASIATQIATGDDWEALATLRRVPQSLRGWEWEWTRSRLPLVVDGVDPAAQWDGHRLVALGRETTAGAETVVVDLADPRRPVSLVHPDGRAPVLAIEDPPSDVVAVSLVAEGQAPEIFILDLDDRRVVERFTFPFEYTDDPTLDPDDGFRWSAELSSVAADGTVAVAYFGPTVVRFLFSSRAARAAGRPPVEVDPGEVRGFVPLLSPDGSLAVSCSSSDGVALYSTATGERIAARELETDLAVFDPSGTKLAVWDEAAEETLVLAVPSLETILHVAGCEASLAYWCPGGKLLVNGMDTDAISRLELATGTCEVVAHGAPGTYLESASADGRYFAATGGREGYLWIHEVDAPREPGYVGGRHGEGVSALEFSPDGRLLALNPPLDPRIVVLDAHTGEELATFERGTPPRPSAVRWAPLVFTPSGRRLVTIEQCDDTHGRTVSVDLFTGEAQRGERFDAMEANTLHPRYLNELEALVGELPRHPRPTACAARDGTLVWNADEWTGAGSVVRTRRSTGASVTVVPGGARSVALSGDGARLAVTLAASVEIRDAATGALLATCLEDEDEPIYSIAAWSPDGARLAVGSQRGRVHLLETTHFRAVCELPPFDRWVGTIAWSPDGARLAVADGDGEVRLYGTIHPIARRKRAELLEARSRELAAELDDLAARGSVSAAVEALLDRAADDAEARAAVVVAALRRWAAREK